MENPLIPLRLSLQALAQPANIQARLFPDFVDLPFELADDVSNWAGVVLAQGSPVSAAQRDAVEAVIGVLKGFSPEDGVWHREALVSDPRWESLRQLAREALTSFGWPTTPPNAPISSYVRG